MVLFGAEPAGVSVRSSTSFRRLVAAFLTDFTSSLKPALWALLLCSLEVRALDFSELDYLDSDSLYPTEFLLGLPELEELARCWRRLLISFGVGGRGVTRSCFDAFLGDCRC